MSKQYGVPTIDLNDALVGQEGERNGLDPIIGNHLRPQGNAIVARVLADKLPALTAATCGMSKNNALSSGQKIALFEPGQQHRSQNSMAAAV